MPFPNHPTVVRDLSSGPSWSFIEESTLYQETLCHASHFNPHLSHLSKTSVAFGAVADIRPFTSDAVVGLLRARLTQASDIPVSILCIWDYWK